MGISTVIPTYRRPGLVVRAVRSALAQTLLPDEVIVVVDGLDDATVQSLKAVEDDRLRVLMPPRNLGNASARNYGIAHAAHEWIALLDDDDEWLPKKLETQLAAAGESGLKYPIVCCRMFARTGKADLIWPRRFPRPGEALCDYMCRRSLPLAGEGLVQSTMILGRRELFQRTRFADGLKVHDDSDWALRAVREPGAGIVFPKTLEPLAIWHIESSRTRASTCNSWRDSLEWGRSRRQYFTREAYAGLICKNVSSLAAASGESGLFMSLLSEARRYGRPSWVDLVSHMMNFVLTPSARDRIWSVVKRLRLDKFAAGVKMPRL